MCYITKSDSGEEDSIQILPHGNTKNKHKDNPYIRTSKTTLDKVSNSLLKGKTISNVYDDILMNDGGPLFSSSRSSEPRDKAQITRRKNLLKEKEDSGQNSTETRQDGILSDLHEQKSNDFIESVTVKKGVYYFFLSDQNQLDDIAQFCCSKKDAAVLGVDITFNICNLWATDTCYRNKRLVNPRTGDNPLFLGPTLLHFQKDEFTFSRFALEILAIKPEIGNLKKIGVDMEDAIFNGMKSIFKGLNRLLCVKHLKGRDQKKISKLLCKSTQSETERKTSMSIILKDLYGQKYGSVHEFGLADSVDPDDFTSKLQSLKDKWEHICPGFFPWFETQRKQQFAESVIESAREGTGIAGLFYQNDIESMHFVEKISQCYKKTSVVELINSLRAIVTRQQTEEIRALYGVLTVYSQNLRSSWLTVQTGIRDGVSSRGSCQRFSRIFSKYFR